MGYKLVNCPECAVEIVKCYLCCMCFVFEECIVCKGLCLFNDCFFKICLNVLFLFRCYSTKSASNSAQIVYTTGMGFNRMFHFFIDSTENNYLELNGKKYNDENGHGRALNPCNTAKLVSF